MLCAVCCIREVLCSVTVFYLVCLMCAVAAVYCAVVVFDRWCFVFCYAVLGLDALQESITVLYIFFYRFVVLL